MTDIAKATTVLNVIAENCGPLTLTGLAARTGLPRSTVHRLIQVLEKELHVVRAVEQPGYMLGPGMLKFGMNTHMRLLAANRRGPGHVGPYGPRERRLGGIQRLTSWSSTR